MKIVIINSGSSSKISINRNAGKSCYTGMIDRIGLDASNISYKTNADSIEESMSIANHKIGLEKIAALLMDRNTGVINSTQDRCCGTSCRSWWS
jgi:acetate kinase